MNDRDPVDYVNPYVGSIGHLLTSTAPIVSLPHGMAQVVPVTNPGVTDRYLADRIYGFQIGCSTLMPYIHDGDSDVTSAYDHDLETATPYYYSVLLEDSDIEIAYTALQTSAYFRVVYPANTDARLLVQLPKDGVISRTDELQLTGRTMIQGVSHYVYMELSNALLEAESSLTESPAGLALQLGKFTDAKVLEVRVGISHLSAEQAKINMEKEIGEQGFEETKRAARTIWNEALGRIEVDGGSESQRATFYSALYRSLLPMMNITEDGKYFSGFDLAVHETGNQDFYTLDNLWDSYRCLHPLQLLLEPGRQSEMISSYLQMFKQSGWLPQFPGLYGDRPYMTGNHAAAFIADTYHKGEVNFDLEQAYEAIRHNAMNATMLPWTDNSPLTELDRIYAEKGFFPALAHGETESVAEVHGFERRQAVSVTLEHAYDDWCVAQLAKALNKEDDYAYFMNRASNYKNLFDERIGFMAPKSADGEWVEGYDPKRGGGQGGRDYFAECNAWIYTFHVQHDIDGLIGLFGGAINFEKKLDALFTEQYSGSKYEFLNQFPDSTGLIGQFCMGNEPAFHIPYLYNYAGTPWKTQRKVREIMKLWFNDGPLGICGDEDHGAMSSWYVFSAMGFYPVCPGKPVYDIGSPLFSEVRIRQQNGKTFTIRATDGSDVNKYIQAAELNGEPYNHAWIRHEDIANGGTLVLHMGPRPNKSWGVTS
ncbi:GH92 family glycosyl hydrolase [Paenibacillus glycanilyticus]|uniref:Alpha-1 2-mannosidase n=1 Tax=Paenibacillus glycanilyticus TaxID=126569 RepID=A0ABQ6GMH0_9BACL|nr:GH92 family glycosyl hydrolase [Paenibacillus glycanilyticus]GLX70578.1 alpha-1 2-mannosidase [Paenibacillus glycanilyticus]